MPTAVSDGALQRGPPDAPPADPQVIDQVVDVVADTVPAPWINVESAWFEDDAAYLYVGLKVEAMSPIGDADGLIGKYHVLFTPVYAALDPTWGGSVPAGAAFAGLRTWAAFQSPTTALPNVAPLAPTFELQATFTQGNGVTNVQRVAFIAGVIDAKRAIVWWEVPRSLLQDPAEGEALEGTSAFALAHVGHHVTAGTAFGDFTGPGDRFVFTTGD